MRQDDEKKDGRLLGAIRIFEALSSVDEELLERSESVGKPVPFWKYAKVMAACVCVVVLGAAAFAGKTMFSAKNSASHDGMASSTAEQLSAGTVSDTAGMSGAADQAAAEAMEDKIEEGAAEDAEPAGEQEKNVLTEALQNNSDEPDMGSGSDSQMTSDISDLLQAERQKETAQDGGIMWDEDFFPAPESLDEADIRATEELGAYVPTEIPAGYVYENGYRTGEADAAESLSVLWKNGMDTIHVSIRRYEESEEMQERLTDISKPETYDVNRYEIPYCDSVPDEYYMTFHYPIFRESDFSLDIVKMRMKRVPDQGDTDTPRGGFAVLYDSGVLVEFNGNGDVQGIWKLFQSIAP